MMLTALAAVAVIGAACASDEPEVKATINLADTQFESLWINNAVAEFVIEAAYGNPVEAIPMTTVIMQTAIVNGDVDIVMELWEQNLIEWHDEEIANGNIENLGMTYEGGPQFFIVPTYTAEEFGIVTIEDMKKPEVVAALADPEEPSKGAFINCVSGWQCAEINRAKFQAYGLDEFYNIITLGSTGAMDAGLQGPQITKTPTFGYYWAPTPLYGSYDWTIVEEPAYTAACWDEVVKGQADASYTPAEACAYESLPINKGINSGLRESAPDVVAMLEKMMVGISPISKTAAWALENDVDVSADKIPTAKYYLENFEDSWTQWMDDDAVRAVKDALAALCSSTPFCTKEWGVTIEVPTRVPATAAPWPTAPPIAATAAPWPTAAATAAPSPTARPTAAPAAAPRGTVPSGEATIAVNRVNAGVGTPRFCTAGCAEDVYVSGIMETLFRPVYGDTLGAERVANVLATYFDLDPNLEWIDFSLREGVQFHDGWGEMTAYDVAFSFNDANRNTQPESIHGQAGDFASLIKFVQVVDDYKVRMHYENFDSRGIRHRFSTFWQSAGIASKALFLTKGTEGMRDFIIGTGPYKNLSWIQSDSIKLEAVPDHYRQTANVAKITLLEVPEASSSRALLETGQVVMAQPALADWNTLAAAGFEINLDSGHGYIRNIAMTGNYWEDNRYYDDKVLERETSDKAWVSNTGRDGEGADAEDYEAARLVRIGLAHAIDRQALVDSILDGWGDGPMYFAYQPPNAHPITQSHAYEYVDPARFGGGAGGAGGWEYPLDYDRAKAFINSGGFPIGFAMGNVWTGPPGLTQELMTAIGGIWAAELGVEVTLNNSVYSTYRPGLVARTTSDPFLGCGDDANTSMPYDWARGFVMSSWSDGGYGAGMEIPFAAKNYAEVTLMVNGAHRVAANEAFAEKGIENALCIGLVHEPVGTVQNPDLVAAYEKLPQANGNLGQFVNLESLKLK